MKKSMLVVFLLSLGLCFAATNQEEIVERMPNLVMQLGIIIFAARLGAIAVERFKIPGVLGELIVGIIIGPYLLGSIPIIGFPHGVFASPDLHFPIQPELYGIAIVASIILLFLSGLETDIDMFIKFSFAGTVIGISGIVFSFAFGALTAMYFLHLPFFDPKCLFLGIMSTATSVGITARILSERKKTDTPEGVTILAGAVIDDVLGVVLLAVIMGISVLLKSGSPNAISWSSIGLLAFKEIGIWLGVSVVGLYFAHKIGGFLKRFKSHIVFSVLAFSFALIVAGLFERVGLAMIIGAYVVGFTLSKTEIRFTIQEALHPLKVFFVPIFFTVMGMLVDISALFSVKTLIFGLVYTIGAVVSKFAGCAFPSLALNFNWLGAKRIGLGMVPRGEVALIVAGIGLSYGFLTDPTYDLFSIAIMMTLITTLIAPPLLNLSLKNEASGVKNTVNMPVRINTELRFTDFDVIDMISHKLLNSFKHLGFFVSKPDPEDNSFQLRKDLTNLSLEKHDHSIIINSDQDSLLLVKRVINQSLSVLKDNLANIHLLEEQLDYSHSNVTQSFKDFYELIDKKHIINLTSDSKEDAIWELINLFNKDELNNPNDIYVQLLSRESSLNSGLYKGLAIPHIHSHDAKNALLAIGLSKKGIDFNSVDGKPSHTIILLITPYNDADMHIHLLSQIIKLVKKVELSSELMSLNTADLRYKRLLEFSEFTK